MKHSKQALCLMDRAVFFARTYDRDEFLDVVFGTVKNYGFLRQWAVGVAKNSYRRTRGSWSDYELRTHYDETAQELILKAIEFLEDKEFETQGHAYNAIQKNVSNRSYGIINVQFHLLHLPTTKHKEQKPQVIKLKLTGTHQESCNTGQLKTKMVDGLRTKQDSTIGEHVILNNILSISYCSPPLSHLRLLLNTTYAMVNRPPKT